MRPYIGCSWILMRAAVGLTDGLGLDGDRCIRVIPRHSPCLPVLKLKSPDIYRATKWDLNYTLQQSTVMPSRACLREVLHISFIHYVCTFVYLHFKIPVGFISETKLFTLTTNHSFYRRWWIPHLSFNWNKCWGATINILVRQNHQTGNCL